MAKYFSPTHRANISKAKTGKKRLDMVGENNPAKRKEVRDKISIALKGRIVGEGWRSKMKQATKIRYERGDIFGFKKCWKDDPNFLKGENNGNWIKDRSKLAKRQERNDMAYKEWRMQVYKRDGYKCRINNCKCSGRIIAHHILGWSSHPDLRYEVNNGITLCLFHHPRKRNDEKKLVPLLQELVIVN